MTSHPFFPQPGSSHSLLGCIKNFALNGEILGAPVNQQDVEPCSGIKEPGVFIGPAGGHVILGRFYSNWSIDCRRFSFPSFVSCFTLLVQTVTTEVIDLCQTIQKKANTFRHKFVQDLLLVVCTIKKGSCSIIS